MRYACVVVAILATASNLRSQTFTPRPKLMVVSAVDVGMSRSVNRGVFEAVSRGTVSSVSVMVVGDAFDDAVAWLRAHPEVDVGLHVVLSAEWPHARWRPVMPPSVVPTLTDSTGAFRRRFDGSRADAREVEQEIRAQLMLARAAGVHVTHLDVHKNALYGGGGRFADALVRIVADEAVTVVLSRTGPTEWGTLALALGTGPMLEVSTAITPVETPARWPRWYEAVVRGAPAGVSRLVVHPGYDDPELRALTEGVDAWGAPWRQRDLDVLLSESFLRELTERRVKLLGMKEVPWRTHGGAVPPP